MSPPSSSKSTQPQTVKKAPASKEDADQLTTRLNNIAGVQISRVAASSTPDEVSAWQGRFTGAIRYLTEQPNRKAAEDLPDDALTFVLISCAKFGEHLREAGRGQTEIEFELALRADHREDVKESLDASTEIGNHVHRIIRPNLQSATLSPAEEKLRELTVGLPEDYVSRAAALSAINSAVREHFAAVLTPALNTHIQAMPHDDLEGKKKVAEFVNSEAERFGLAVKCPKTGLPGKLKASTGHWPGRGRFHFEVYIEGKQKKPAFSDTLPELMLIDANPLEPTETPWQNKVGPKPKRSGRKLS